MQVYFTVNVGRKFWDSNWCPLNKRVSAYYGARFIKVSLYLFNLDTFKNKTQWGALLKRGQLLNQQQQQQFIGIPIYRWYYLK